MTTTVILFIVAILAVVSLWAICRRGRVTYGERPREVSSDRDDGQEMDTRRKGGGCCR